LERVTTPSITPDLLKILSFLRCAIDDEIIAVLTNFLVFHHEDGDIAAQFRSIVQKFRDRCVGLSIFLPLWKRGIEGDLSNKISPNLSATAPCVALDCPLTAQSTFTIHGSVPPASMQSSFSKRGT